MDDRLTVAQSLRHARHDFLNELQMIKLNLDLGRTDRAQALIRTYAEAAMHQSRLSALSMPETEEWLLTAGWRFPELRLAVFCEAERAPRELDAVLCSWLETFADNAKKSVFRRLAISGRAAHNGSGRPVFAGTVRSRRLVITDFGFTAISNW
ncbi:Spo0B domain-containing protein [Planococcus citreus]|uniref:Sensor kinase SpoOB-type protein n=1 Tax=Planococcus citreus TaxID=1373 RepID=A0A497YN42_9BACL|nr:Spo0B domain-containing protein [Planococcus citreus]RLJ87210.1 sensor kinase SpoOB-type protein [Planococcus citreus]